MALRLDVDERADRAFDDYVVEVLDDWNDAIAEDRERARAKRAAAQVSVEEAFLLDARLEGQKAGERGLGPQLNPFDEGVAGYKEWEAGRKAGLEYRLRRKTA